MYLLAVFSVLGCGAHPCTTKESVKMQEIKITADKRNRHFLCVIHAIQAAKWLKLSLHILPPK
jgi:hypothetical protein